MFCGKCGEGMKDEDMFCPKCGWQNSSSDKYDQNDTKKLIAVMKNNTRQKIIFSIVVTIIIFSIIIFPLYYHYYLYERYIPASKIILYIDEENRLHTKTNYYKYYSFTNDNDTDYYLYIYLTTTAYEEKKMPKRHTILEEELEHRGAPRHYYDGVYYIPEEYIDKIEELDAEELKELRRRAYYAIDNRDREKYYLN